jgi:putative hydrolase of the HAD superfamily
VVRNTTCVVFDIDDTLYLERDYVLSGFRAVDAAARSLLGVTGFLDRAVAHFSLGARGDVFDRTLVDLGVEPTAELITALVHCYRHHEPAINLLPDARQALSLARAAAGVAVVSDGPAASQGAKVRALGLVRWADPVVLTAERCADRAKPDVRGFELVQEALAVEPEQCAYVADNPAKDFAGPARLGWRTVRVRRNGGLHAATDSGGDVEIELGQLTALGRVLGFAR